jgi:hypothetical protein
MGFEGGFNGRANKPSMGVTCFGKVVCWANRVDQHDNENGDMKQPWLSDLSNSSTTATTTTGAARHLTLLLFDEGAQRYILLCAQDVHGGLVR